MSQNPNSLEGVRYQLRSDLDYAEYSIGDQQQLVVKDRLKIEYFFFQSLERMALSFLKTPLSIAQLKSKIDERIAPATIEFDETKMFVSRLLRDNLLTSNLPMAKKAGSVTRKSVAGKITGLLAIRFRGINPRRMLDRLNPYTRGLFSPISFGVVLLLFLTALLGFVLNVSTVFENQFLWSSIARSEILLPLGLAIIVTKTLHELGHALACRAIGRDCHEIGVMFLAFMPCLYCNVSDVWMEPNRWKRILVSGAGIFVEMLIAAACVPLFLWCRPGSLQLFFFSLIVVSSVSTLFVNGNPLLKYDGYYIFSDLLQRPNMYAKAQSSWLEDVVGFFFYSNSAEQTNEWGLSLYGVLSFLYRCIVLGVIVTMVFAVLANWQLNRLAWTLSIVLAVAVVLQMFGGVWAGLKQSGSNSGKLRPARAMGCLAIAALMLVLLFCVPFESRIFTRGKVVAAGNTVVFAPGDGQIEWQVSAGDKVNGKQLLATVSDRRLDEELLIKAQEIEQIQLALDNQQVLLRQGAANQAEIQLLIQSLANAKKLDGLLRKERKSLEIVSNLSGVLQPFPTRNPPGRKALTRNAVQSNVIDRAAIDFVKRGEALATITSRTSYEVELAVRSRDAKFLEQGSTVRMSINGSKPRVFIGQVAEIGLESNVLQSNGWRTRSTDRTGSETSNFITIRAGIDNGSAEFRLESKVTAIVFGQRQTLFQMLLHRLRSSFKI